MQKVLKKYANNLFNNIKISQICAREKRIIRYKTFEKLKDKFFFK